MEQKLEEQKVKIQILGLDKIKDYFEIPQQQLEQMDTDVLKHLYNMARLGMQFEKEMNVTKRATEMNFVRIGKMISENKEEIKKYIKKTLPQYIPKR